MLNIFKNILVVINDFLLDFSNKTDNYSKGTYRTDNYSKGVYIDIDGQILNTKICGNCIYYYNSKNQHHRLDGPASQYPDGSSFWYKNNEWHRIGGPAVFDGGIYKWWINGKKVKIYYICG